MRFWHMEWIIQRLAFVILFVHPSIAWSAESSVAHHLVGHEESELLLRIQDRIDDWDPRKLVNPLVETSRSTDSDGNVLVRKQLRRSDLAEFIADADAAEALGKAFFWEMQAGSDFRLRTIDGQPQASGTACASCHYRHGADARDTFTQRIPYIAWDAYRLHPLRPLEFGQMQHPYDVFLHLTRRINTSDFYPFKRTFQLVVGSQGVPQREFRGFRDHGAWKEEEYTDAKWNASRPPEWAMFRNFRQITNRNSPTVVNAAFSDRLFHDGRAESTFNGFSIFGDADPREVIHRRVFDGSTADSPSHPPNDARLKIVPVHIAITRAALASQAVGPIVNNVEMSYDKRDFPDVAEKLLDAKILAFQDVSDSDSLLSRYPVGKQANSGMTYRQLIQQAFRSEWWDDRGFEDQTPLMLKINESMAEPPRGSLMHANFSLYWGLSVMLYEASLVTNESPFDEMMRGRPNAVESKWDQVKNRVGRYVRRDQKVETPPPLQPPFHQSGSAVFQHGFRVFLNRGCADCHDGPFFSEAYDRLPEAEKLAIHYTIERTLLPNSRSDALAANWRDARRALYQDLASIVSGIPSVQHRAQKIAMELDELRHSSFGRKDFLRVRILDFLQRLWNSASNDSVNEASLNEMAEKITDRLFSYEKSLVTRLGNRTFFSEDERVAMAEALGGPVLIEKMTVPPNQIKTRPSLPIAGPLATEGYAFYDLAFYTLGVAPPRYDRGIGDRKRLETSAEYDALLETIEKFLGTPVVDRIETPDARETNENRLAAQKALDTLEETHDAQLAQQAVENDPRLSQDGKNRFLRTVRESTEAADQAPMTSSPGKAYQFKRVWKSPRYQSPGVPAVQERPNPDQPAVLEPQVIQEGPLLDTSWDRIDLPYGDKDPQTDDDIQGPARRNSYYFLARTRRLVHDEQHWGYRKPFLHDNELAFWGAFRTPTLRNVELTAPYMHNGRFLSLEDVIDFYDDEDQSMQIPRDSPTTPDRFKANPDKHPAIGHIDLSDHDKRALLFFLLCLTDDRVRYEQAPFDHPSIRIINGYQQLPDGSFEEMTFHLDATGQAGHPNQPSRTFPADE